jgi:acyl-CoA thioester hydrolase
MGTVADLAGRAFSYMAKSFVIQEPTIGGTRFVTLPVQWGDQDALGHVNNAIFLRWFESGRVALFESLGLDWSALSKGVAPILASVTVNFRRPVTFPATVDVHTRVAKTGRTSLTVEHRVRVRGDQVDSADGIAVIVLYDYVAARPHPLPSALVEVIRRCEQCGTDTP